MTPGDKTSRVQWADGFRPALDKVAPPGSIERSEIAADLRSFSDDWNKGMPIGDLAGKWSFKWLEGNQAKQFGVRQIRVGDGNSHRVCLTVVKGGVCWLLDIFRKTKQVDKAAVDRAIRRAKIIQEENS